MKGDPEAFRIALLDAHEEAIRLRAILDRALDQSSTGAILVPRALLESVTAAHSFLAGWCIAKLDEEAEKLSK